MAVQAEDENLAEYFHHMARAAYARSMDADAEMAGDDMLPGNLREMAAVSELLRCMREDDPEAQPVLREIQKLLDRRRALLEEERERARQAAAQQPPGPTQRDRLLAKLRATDPEDERKRREEDPTQPQRPTVTRVASFLVNVTDTEKEPEHGETEKQGWDPKLDLVLQEIQNLIDEPRALAEASSKPKRAGRRTPKPSLGDQIIAQTKNKQKETEHGETKKEG
jgi:hypothetical protein